MKTFRNTFLLLLVCGILISFNCEINLEPQLIEFSSSECEDNISYKNLYKLNNRILSVDLREGISTYEIFVVANCSEASSGKIEVKNDTLNLKFDGTPYIIRYEENYNEETGITEVIEESITEHADCDCAFKLKYKIKGLTGNNYVVLANGKEIFKTNHKYKIRRDKPKFDIVNNDTINLIDIYGLKQGVHIFKRKDGKIYSKMMYSDNEKITGLAHTYYNFDGFDKVETFMSNELYTKRKYYKKNKLIKECDTDGSFDEGTNCKYFN